MPSLHCSPSLRLVTVITSLILVMLVNGGPVCPPSSSPALPLVKLPVGYYRDVFINAVYDSLSALSLTAFTSSFSTPIYPSPLKWHLSFFFFLSFFFLSVWLSVCLSHGFLLHMSLPSSSFALSLLSLCRNLIILLISSPAAVNVTCYASLIAQN